jgi:competence protein ComFA
MKASLYLVCSEWGWRAYWSLSLQVDADYWLNERFRVIVSERLMTEGVLADMSMGMVGWKESLPLGVAEKACLLLEAKLGRRHNREAATFSMAANDLAGVVREVAGQIHESAGAAGGAKKEVWILQREAARVDVGGYPLPPSTYAGKGLNWRSADADKGLSGRISTDAEIRGLVDFAQAVGDKLQGRALLSSEAEAVMEERLLGQGVNALNDAIQLASLLGFIRLASAIGHRGAGTEERRSWWNLRLWRERERGIQCRRCGAEAAQLRRSPCASCGLNCAFCEQCLTMGRTRECGLLIMGRATGNGITPSEGAVSSTEHWKLSPAQSEAAGQALQFIRNTLGGNPSTYSNTSNTSNVSNVSKTCNSRDSSTSSNPGKTSNSSGSGHTQNARSFLLWAVTGAGKTEMIFPLIEEVVRSGGRAVVATPRRDVVLELAPRLAVAFPDTGLSVLYGGSPDKFGMSAITLATTHQLLRCHEAFDLVLIDELDAYPYHNNPMLHFAADKSRKPNGVTVLLSATPPQALMRLAARGELPHARVPVRYHRHPLPVPVRMDSKPLSYWISKGVIPSRVLLQIKKSIARGAQLFVFVPNIADVDRLVRLFRGNTALLGVEWEAIKGTSSKDSDRAEKVTAFRERTIRLLVTTTILERGVTVPKSDVFVVSADNPQFDGSALVQMAGRAGRSGDDPFGHVYFISKVLTKSQREAIHQIRHMNRIAKKKGYLHRREEGQ